MQQDDLSALLRQIPRAGASEGFEERVRVRLLQRRTRRTQLRVAAAVLFVMVSSLGAWSVQHQRHVARIEAARHEQMALARELAQLKVQSARYEPLVVVGRTSHEAYVLDLRKPAGQVLQRTSSAYW